MKRFFYKILPVLFLIVMLTGAATIITVAQTKNKKDVAQKDTDKSKHNKKTELSANKKERKNTKLENKNKETVDKKEKDTKNNGSKLNTEKQVKIKNKKYKNIAKPINTVSNSNSIKSKKYLLWLANKDAIANEKKELHAKNKKNHPQINAKANLLKLSKDTFLIKGTRLGENKKDGMNELYISNYGAEDIIIDYSNEDYAKVIKNSIEYLQNFPTDTNIIIKTGLSYLFTQKYNQGFAMIDASFINKDSLTQFYSVLPFINMHAKDDGVYEKIVEHCRLIAPNNIWTSFSAATMFNTRGNFDSAYYFANQTHQSINDSQEANSLGYFYPTLLFHNGNMDSATTIIKKLCGQYPNNISLYLNLLQMLKKQKKWDEAYFYIEKIVNLDRSNEDYFQEKIDVCIEMKNTSEACKMLNEVNRDFSYDEKIFKAHCTAEFANVPFQHQTKYIWKINQKGESFQLFGIVDVSNANIIRFDYWNTGKAGNKGFYNIAPTSFDTCRKIDATYFNSTRYDDSSTKLITWISKECYNEIENSGQTILDIGSGLGIFRLINVENEDDGNIFLDRVIMPDGQKKLLETFHLFNTDSNEQIWILKNKTNPLIVKMDGIFTMELSEVSKQ
jgi:tetratricopeptide (TPR) repeat protein